MDTVQLKGEHFASKVKVGTRVHRGQVLVEPEWDAIAAAGYDLTTPVVVTNAQKFGGVTAAASRPVEAGDEMLEVTQKGLALV